jgi:membrane protein involved in D-alanine export
MTPYADFLFFGLMLYPVVPTVILGLLGRAGWRWTLFVTLAVLVVVFAGTLHVRPQLAVREIWIVIGYALFTWAVANVFLRAQARTKSRWPFRAAIGFALLPLAAAKFLPLIAPSTQFGFLGISYVTFRVLDVIFSVNDKLIASLPAAEFIGYVFFFPAISSGPIDRYRRFDTNWKQTRTRQEFLLDLDAAVHRLFRGFFYKFIIAAVLKSRLVDHVAKSHDLGNIVLYMYAYSLYLFFDFAGYSAFAIAFSYLFGIRTPENFDKPFLARNIRDFWNRWHITLSFWFRDHVYMRFLLAAAKGKWFKNKNLAASLGFFLSFGLMGLWHGVEPYYLIYGVYHASLLAAYDAFSRWNKKRKLWGDGPFWRATNVFLTANFVCFGFLIFSGHLWTKPLSNEPGMLEKADCEEIAGWAWNSNKPNSTVEVDVYSDGQFIKTVIADQFRQDLLEKGFGNGKHGFRFPTHPFLKDGDRHVITVRLEHSDRDMPGAKTLQCAPVEP